MKIQEAIEYMRMYKGENVNGESHLGHAFDLSDEIIDMAIEALQRGLENVNADSCSEKPNRSDLIRRQDAIDVAKQHWYKPDIAKALEELPSAQPELIEKEAYIRGFEQGRTQGMIDEQTKVRTQMSSADCISRQDAIEVAKKHWYKPDIAGALAELPSAQLKPKTAESGSVDSEMPEVKTDRTTSGDLISRQAAIKPPRKEN